MSAPMTPEPIAEIRAEVERLAAKAAKPNQWPVDNEAHAMADGWARGTENALKRTTRPLLAEVERLSEQLAAFAPPGALSPGETPALCGTCTDRLCVPGLPGCARCVKTEAERLRAELAETTHVLEVTGEKLTAIRGQRDRAEAERDDVVAELEEERLTGDALRKDRDQIHSELTAARAALTEERARHGELVAEMQRERKAADDSRAEQVRLAEQVRVLAGLLRRGNPKVFCSKHPDHAEPGCEVCRDAGIFRAALGEQDGDADE